MALIIDARNLRLGTGPVNCLVGSANRFNGSHKIKCLIHYQFKRLGAVKFNTLHITYNSNCALVGEITIRSPDSYLSRSGGNTGHDTFVRNGGHRRIVSCPSNALVVSSFRIDLGAKSSTFFNLKSN